MMREYDFVRDRSNTWITSAAFKKVKSAAILMCSAPTRGVSMMNAGAKQWRTNRNEVLKW